MSSAASYEPVRISAEEHCDCHISEHAPCVSVKDIESMFYRFSSKADDVRIDTVRCMLLSHTTPPRKTGNKIHAAEARAVVSAVWREK